MLVFVRYLERIIKVYISVESAEESMVESAFSLILLPSATLNVCYPITYSQLQFTYTLIHHYITTCTVLLLSTSTTSTSDVGLPSVVNFSLDCGAPV